MDINVVLDYLKEQIGELTLQVAILKAQSKALEEELAKNKGGDKK